MGENRRFDDASLSKLEFSNEICGKIYKWVKEQRNFLVFTGNPGLGKSFLCHALKNDLRRSRYSIRLYKETEYFSAIRLVISEHNDYQFEVDRICDCDLLILDDIVTSQMTDWQREVLFLTIDKRYESNKPTVLTSNISINQMAKIMGDKFTSRLCDTDNTVIQMWGIDRRTGKDYSIKPKEEEKPQEPRVDPDKEFWEKKKKECENNTET